MATTSSFLQIRPRNLGCIDLAVNSLLNLGEETRKISVIRNGEKKDLTLFWYSPILGRDQDRHRIEIVDGYLMHYDLARSELTIVDFWPTW